MKRDDDLIRDLLFEIEANERSAFLLSRHMGMTREEDKKFYHAQLLCDAGLLVESGKNGGVFRMTNPGHDYLIAIRKIAIWEKTKVAASLVGGASLSMMFSIATAYGKAELTEILGFDLE